MTVLVEPQDFAAQMLKSEMPTGCTHAVQSSTGKAQQYRAKLFFCTLMPTAFADDYD